MKKQVHYKDKENINYEKLDNEALFKIYKETKNNDIRELLIEKNLYIAEILSKKYVNRGIDYDDIFQVASIGLIYAVDRFDVDKGYKFSSFATPTIIGEIKKYFRDKGWTIRVPRRIQELSKKINNAKIHLNQKLQRAPTVDDIAKYLKSTPEEILEAMEASKVYTPQSLDLTYDSNSDDKDVNLSDLIGVEDEHFDRIENKDLLIKGTKNLNEMEKKILVDRYFNLKTQVAIADELGISQMTVSRMEKRVIEKIQKELEKAIDS